MQDYESTLQFLEEARQWARQTPHSESYLANVMAEEAFCHFDINHYGKADSLMRTLEKTGFRHIDLENKSKLVMQQGYLLFMAKQYPQAEATYDKAIGWMRASSPCDLPMIYVKKMELYNAMQWPDQMREAFRESGRYADSCGVIKYHIYALEQLLRIYKGHNDPATAAGIAHRLDSLNLLYAQTQHLAGLHNQKQAMVTEESDRELRHEQSRRTYLTFGLVAVGLVTFTLLGWLVLYQRKKRGLEAEFVRMKADLEAYLAQQQHAPPTDAIPLPVADPIRTPQPASELLSARQQQVLTSLAAGLSNREIADQLFVSENTVKYHIRNIYQLLHLRDRKDLFINFKK